MHHVAAAEGLRVLEGGAVHAHPRLQVDEVQHHGGGAEIDREPQHVPAVAVHHGAVVEHVRAPPGDDGIARRRRFSRIRPGRGQDARTPAERRERHVDVAALDRRLAGEAVGGAQEALRLGARTERVLALADLDHAFVAAAVAQARGRHLDGELVGAIEERHAERERLRLAVVGDRAGRDRARPFRLLRPFAPGRSAPPDLAELLPGTVAGAGVGLPREPIVEGAVVAAGRGLALGLGGDLVAAREGRGAAVARVAVGAALRGLLVGMAHDIGKDPAEPVEPLLIVLSADLRQGPAYPRSSIIFLASATQSSASLP